METTLIDISKIPNIESIIGMLLEESKNNAKDIDLLSFLVKAQNLKKSPKGVGKKSPQVYYPTSSILLDAYFDFFSLVENMLKIMKRISDVFYDELQEKVKKK